MCVEKTPRQEQERADGRIRIELKRNPEITRKYSWKVLKKNVQGIQR
jgi:hypothetical protein